jgi:N6-adenosine-specific RNA methylase IME4
MKYSILYADPPWSYQASGAPAAKRPSLYRGEKPHSVNHYYETLSLDQIKKLPVSCLLEKDAVLFLWIVNPLFPYAFDVMKAWGFNYKTCITWEKERCKGMGYWFRGHTEHLLLGVRGNVTAFRSLEHNIVKLPVGKHSEKPPEFRGMIERATSKMPIQTRLELFARQSTPGWDVWGNEVVSNIELGVQYEVA